MLEQQPRSTQAGGPEQRAAAKPSSTGAAGRQAAPATQAPDTAHGDALAGMLARAVAARAKVTGGAMLMRVATPSGTVVPASGPHSGQTVGYGDGRGKHTRVADQPLADMLAAWTNHQQGKPVAPALATFVTKQGSVTYGSQLSQEGNGAYSALAKTALEAAATAKATHIGPVQAASSVGVNIQTMAATSTYAMNKNTNDGLWHLFPA